MIERLLNNGFSYLKDTHLRSTLKRSHLPRFSDLTIYLSEKFGYDIRNRISIIRQVFKSICLACYSNLLDQQSLPLFHPGYWVGEPTVSRNRGRGGCERALELLSMHGHSLKSQAEQVICHPVRILANVRLQ